MSAHLFFKFISVYIKMSFKHLENHSQLLCARDSENERLLLCQFDVLSFPKKFLLLTIFGNNGKWGQGYGRRILTNYFLQAFGFIKRVDKGCITTVKDLESWSFEG